MLRNVLYNEPENYFKIQLRGLLLVVFLPAVHFLIRKGGIIAGNRKWIYTAAVNVFGVIPAGNLSLTGTANNATVLFGPGARFSRRGLYEW